MVPEIETPPGFIVRTNAQKAAADNGYRLPAPPDPAEPGWLRYASTTAAGTLRLAAATPSGPWFLALDHPGVIAELPPPDPIPGPGDARWRFPTLSALYPTLSEVYRLASTLPDLPLSTFEARTASPGRPARRTPSVSTSTTASSSPPSGTPPSTTASSPSPTTPPPSSPPT